MRRRIIILGSTGSIGCSALDVLAGLEDGYQVVGLSACRSWKALAQQALRLRPQAVAIAQSTHAEALRSALVGCSVYAGPHALTELVRQTECDYVLAAVVGAAGLPATLAAVEAGHMVGLANKEALVVAGGLIMPLADKTGAELIPVDSEHSAIFQALRCGHRPEVSRVFLTASGGPFRTWSPEQMANATLQDALNHPAWQMGRKVTIDSATMMNKALEIVEARWLFDLGPEHIEVLVHPEAIVHSMVEFCDGSIIAQLGTPDMRTPIQYALTYPHRLAGRSERLDMPALRQMHFEPPDLERFPAILLGYRVAREGATYGAVLNGANEAAVEAFCQGAVSFGQIVSLVQMALDRHTPVAEPDLAALLAADRWARNEVRECLKARTQA